MGKKDSIKRILVLQLVTFEFILDVLGYACVWFFIYKKMIMSWDFAVGLSGTKELLNWQEQ